MNYFRNGLNKQSDSHFYLQVGASTAQGEIYNQSTFFIYPLFQTYLPSPRLLSRVSVAYAWTSGILISLPPIVFGWGRYAVMDNGIRSLVQNST